MFFKNLVKIGIQLSLVTAVIAMDVLADGAQPKDSLTLQEARKRVYEFHPDLEAGRQQINASQGMELQSGTGPNPELQLEIEDFAGTGDFSGFQSATTSLQISQAIEWGGKRSKRKQMAATEKILAIKNLEQKKSALNSLLKVYYTSGVVAQHRLNLARNAGELSHRLHAIVKNRMQNGAASDADELRAGMAVAEAEMEIRKYILEFESSKKKLALLWGNGQPQFAGFQDDLTAGEPPPSLQGLDGKINNTPDIIVQSQHILLTEARLASEKSLASPDITVSGGVRYAAEPGDMSILGSISLPLPLRNTNKGGVTRASHEIHRAKAEKKLAFMEIKSRILEIHHTLNTSWEEIQTLEKQLIPQTEKASRFLREGYNRGRYSLLDVLETEKDLFNYRLRHLNAMSEYQSSYIQWNRLTGSHAHEYTNQSHQPEKRG